MTLTLTEFVFATFIAGLGVGFIFGLMFAAARNLVRRLR